MNDKRAKRLVRKSIKALRQALYLNTWKIDICYGKLPADQMGSCAADPKYSHATITIDPTEHSGKKQLLDTLRHEMLHIVLAQFETFRRACYQFTPSRNVDDSLDEVWFLAQEQTVAMLERVLDWNGLTATKMSREIAGEEE